MKHFVKANSFFVWLYHNEARGFMKKCIAMIVVLLSAGMVRGETVFWNDLEAGPVKYSLIADVPLSPSVTLYKNHPFVLEEIFFSSLPLVHFTMRDLLCENPDLSTELELFNPEPENTAEDKSIGVQMHPGCLLEVIVESKYYYDRSIFY